MHIIIAAITAIAGLIWALNSLQRSGFDLNSLNPFYWIRRKRWENKQVHPLYSIEEPRELVGLLMFAVLRQGGDPTAEQKHNLLSLYQSELKYNEKQSADMYTLASYQLGTDANYTHKVAEIIAPSAKAITDSQLHSIPDLLSQVAEFQNAPNNAQQDFLGRVTDAIDRVGRRRQ